MIAACVPAADNLSSHSNSLLTARLSMFVPVLFWSLVVDCNCSLSLSLSTAELIFYSILDSGALFSPLSLSFANLSHIVSNKMVAVTAEQFCGTTLVFVFLPLPVLSQCSLVGHILSQC